MISTTQTVVQKYEGLLNFCLIILDEFLEGLVLRVSLNLSKQFLCITYGTLIKRFC